jgi:hypothetical protein
MPDAQLAAERSLRGSVPTPRYAPVVAIGTPTVLVTLHALVYGRWIVDDAAITFAYARSITDGLGPVLQEGAPPVEGYSNPSWLALLMAGRWAHLFDHGQWFGVPDYVAFPKLLALLCCALLFGAFYRIAVAVTRWPITVTVVAGGIVALLPSFVIWAFSGLENSVLAMTVGWLAALLTVGVIRGELLSARTATACGSLAALAALTRPDGMIYALAYPLAALLLVSDRRGLRLRAALLALSVFAIPVIAYALWRFSTFGLVVPNTAIAKAQGLPGFRNVLRGLELIRFSGVAPALLGGGLVVAALRQRTAQTPALLAILLMFGLAFLEYSLLPFDWMAQRRFATPVWVMGALTITVAGALVLADASRRRRNVVAATAAVTAAVCAVVFADAALSFRRDPTVPVCAVASYAGWTVSSYAAALGLRDAKVVTADVGGTAMVTDLRIIDLAGLTDRNIARRWAENDFSGLRDDVFAAKPEFIETHDGWSKITGLTEDPRLASQYMPLSQTSDTDGLWARSDLATAFAALTPRPASPRSLPLGTSPTPPYQLVNPLASCAPLSPSG